MLLLDGMLLSYNSIFNTKKVLMAKKVPWTIFPKLKESHSSLVGIQYVVISRWYGRNSELNIFNKNSQLS